MGKFSKRSFVVENPFFYFPSIQIHPFGPNSPSGVNQDEIKCRVPFLSAANRTRINQNVVLAFKDEIEISISIVQERLNSFRFRSRFKKLSRCFPTVIFWADIFPHFSYLRLKCLFVIIFVPINFLVNFLTSYDYFGSVSNQFCCGGIFVHAICFQTSSPTYSGAADMGLDIGAVCKREDIVESGPPYWRLDSVYLRKCQCTAQPTPSGRNSLRGLLETLF